MTTKPESTSVADQPAADSTNSEQGLAPAPQNGVAEKGTKAAVRMGLAPRTIEEGWRLAQWIANSEMVPKQYRNKPGDVLIAIQYGMELGFPPMQALQSIAVINGRPSVWGDGFLALIIGSDVYREHDEYFLVQGERRDVITLEDLKRDDTTAVSTFWRRDRTNPIVGYFSVGQAKKANLLGKDGPWQTYPDRMLKMRARGFAGRDGFADILRAVRTTEELLDTPADEDLPAIPRRPDPVQPRRASDARAPVDTAAQPAPPASSEPAPAPGPAAPAPSAAPVGQEIRGLRITNTTFVKPKDAGVEPYYEITAATTTGAVRTFVTRDEQVYLEAASFEGTDYLVVLSVHDAPKAGANVRVQVVDRIAIYEGGAATEPQSGLFGE